MREPEELERLLDSALSSYGSPAPGLEDRVLRAVGEESWGRAAQERQPRRLRLWRLWWAVALPLGACGLILVVLMMRSGHPQDAARVEVPRAPHAAVPAAPRRERPAAVLPAKRRLPRTGAAVSSQPVTAKLPKREVFPSPQPLTPSEEALVSYIAGAAEDSRRTLLEAQQRRDAPVRISAIEIPPITTPAIGHQGEP